VSEAVAVAHPNVALSKYWGKIDRPGNFPAVPSLSVTLSGLSTRTHVAFDRALQVDRFVLNGREADDKALVRAVSLLDRVRAAAREERRARVTSSNDFPTAAGLASSASGFAALALAASRAAGLDWDSAAISDLARRSSASAARSVFGGFVELASGAREGAEGELLAAEMIAPPDHLPLAVTVGVATEKAKAIGSTDGMRLTMTRSPYAEAWLHEAPRMHEKLRAAVLAKDFAAVGELAEASALAMHACAVAAGVVYWTGVTLDALAAVRSLRAAGTAAFVTIDAGPHVKVLSSLSEASRVRDTLGSVPGILRVIEARVGEGAWCEARAESAS
jgi:diphosphomevalonate decarboxylase